jgi:hypothetical protein
LKPKNKGKKRKKNRDWLVTFQRIEKYDQKKRKEERKKDIEREKRMRRVKVN